jgi:hypothetical protein
LASTPAERVRTVRPWIATDIKQIVAKHLKKLFARLKNYISCMGK